MSDPHAGLDDEGLSAVCVQQHDTNLAAITRVDQTRCIDDGDPVLRGQPRARLDESCVPLRNRHGESRADDRPLPRLELDVLARGEIEAGIARISAYRDDGVLAETLDRQLDHLAERAGSSRASASK